MRFKSLIKTAVSLITIFTLSITLNAQSLPEMGNLGIRANIGGQSSIEMPYMLNESISIAPFLSFNNTEDTSTNFQFGVRPRYYTGMNNELATYFAGALGLSNTSFEGVDNSFTDFNLGVGYGAEYFFSDRFSLSADANLNARFGDNADTIFTNARVSASFYF